MTQSGRAAIADVRLAIPVAAAWAASALVAPVPETGWGVSAGLMTVAMAALAAGNVHRIRSVAVVVAVSAAFASLAVAAATVALPPDVASCASARLRVIEHGETPVLVDIAGSECDSAVQPAANAVLLEAIGADDAPAPLGLGSTATGECEAWRSGSTLLLRCRRVEVIERAWWAEWATGLRGELRDTAARLPGDGAALLPGLAIGDVTAVDAGLEAAMQSSGLTHLTAVSGANCAIVVAVGFGIGVSSGLGRRGRVLVGVVMLVGFVVLVGPDPSVLRASVMALFALWALWRGTPRTGVALVALTVFVLLLASPRLATSPGLALSVLATSGLILHGLPLTAVLARWVPTWLAASVAIPLAAQVWCLPVLVVLDARLSLLAVPANMLAAPAAPVATVAGLVTCLATLIHPSIAIACAWVGWLPAAWIGAIAREGDRLDWNLPWPIGWWGVACATATIVVLAIGVVRKRTRFIVISLVTVVSLAVGSVHVPNLVFAYRLPAWVFAQCDVGQGSASVARVDGRTVVVDTGPDPDVLETCLERLAVDHVDVLVLTHFDLDHVGGATALVGNVTTLIHGPEDSDGQALTAQFAAAGAAVAEVQQGDVITVGTSSITVLWPPPESEPGNAASVVTEFDWAGFRALVLGDLDADAQRRLLPDVEPVDVVVVAHHGSRDQAIELYAQLSPALAIVPVGPNDYGHPHASILNGLEGLGAVVVRTDTNGMIALNADVLWRERGAEQPP